MYGLIRLQHAHTVSRVECLNSALSGALQQLPIYTVGGWVKTYNTAATSRQGAKSGTDAKVLKTKLSLKLDECLQEYSRRPLALGLHAGRPLPGRPTVLLGPTLPNDMPGADVHCRVSAARCKPSANPHDMTDSPDTFSPG